MEVEACLLDRKMISAAILPASHTVSSFGGALLDRRVVANPARDSFRHHHRSKWRRCPRRRRYDCQPRPGLKRSTLTDTAGEYGFPGLPTGTYSLRMEKPGLQSQIREGLALSSASEVRINSQLAIGDLSRETTVHAYALGVDNMASTVAGFVPEQGLADLPLNNRDLFSAVTLEPGVAPNPSSAPSLLSSGKSGPVAISGIRPSMTNVLIDGMDATDPVWGYSPAGASGFFLGLSGTNHFHGSLWELRRDASLDAKNYFDLGASPIPPFVRNQFGAGVGGPLKRHRTFIFADYEGFREVQATTAIATVPDALAHQGLLPPRITRQPAATLLPEDVSPSR